MRSCRVIGGAAVFAAVLLGSCAGTGAPLVEGAATEIAMPVDATPRIALMPAYTPEIEALLPSLEDPQTYVINGTTFHTGTMAGAPVVLFKTGVSVVNAAMNTQLALDAFHVTDIVVSGVAGGLDPSLSIGDVTVPAKWGLYDEVLYMRQKADGSYSLPLDEPLDDYEFPFGKPYQFMVPRGVVVPAVGDAAPERRFWFEADPRLLGLAAQAVETATYERCSENGQCLDRDPTVAVGGAGVTGSIYMDNADVRAYLHDEFGAQAVEMETAAVAQVAYSNGVPYVAFRSLSDLAGGGDGPHNEMIDYEYIAAKNAASLVLAFLAAYVAAEEAAEEEAR